MLIIPTLRRQSIFSYIVSLQLVWVMRLSLKKIKRKEKRKIREMAQHLTPTALPEDPSLFPSSQKPVTPVPRNQTLLDSMSTCTQLHTSIQRHTYNYK